jgi:hypothetical protein
VPTREAVMTALLALAATAAEFQTVSRRIVLVPGAPTPQVAAPPAQPALYLFEDNETTRTHPARGAPPIRTWRVQLWVWCKIPLGATPGVPDGVTPGASIINPMIDAIEAALAPDTPISNTLTLGGLVQHCWIEGETVKVSGDSNPDGQCVAMIPVSILVP